MRQDDLDGWDEGGTETQEGGDIYIHLADFLHYIPETNMTLQSNYTPNKFFKKKRKTKCSLVVDQAVSRTPWSSIGNSQDSDMDPALSLVKNQ